MSKEVKTIIRIGALFMTLTVVSVVSVFEIERRRQNNRNSEIDNSIENAKKELENLHEGVAEAVKKVYEEEASNEFSKTIKKVDLISMADKYCKASVKDLEESTIKRVLQLGYSSKADSLVKEELKKYFDSGIEKYIELYADETYIRRSVNKYLNEYVDTVIEKSIDKKMTREDIKEAIENYINRHRSKYDYKITEAIVDSIYRDEKFSSELIKYVQQSIDNEFDSNSYLTDAIDGYLEEHFPEIEAIVCKYVRR